MPRKPLSDTDITAHTDGLFNLLILLESDRTQIAHLRAENKQLNAELTDAKARIATL
jgi:hypothetical protein